MTLAITLCDDSRFARRQLERALPARWGFRIHHAENGRQALSAVRDGRAGVLFLDLTMPEMDGIQVLRALRDQGLESDVFVVSADIQAPIRQTVMELGARCFLQKPVQAGELERALREAGYDVEGGRRELPDRQQVEIRDWLAEIVNVAMGRAAQRLQQALGTSVELSVPVVDELRYPDLAMVLADTLDHSGSALLTQGFIGGGLNGECLLYLTGIATNELRELLRLDDDSPADELLLDLAGVLNGALLQGLFPQLDRHVTVSQPVLLRGTEDLGRPSAREEQLLSLELTYGIEQLSMSCNQLLIFTPASVERLRRYAADFKE